MNSISKIILALIGAAAIGITTYYIIDSRKNQTEVIEIPVLDPEQEIVTIAEVLPESTIDKITKELYIYGEEFTITDEEGVYRNKSNDKLLIIKEDIWKKIIRKVQVDFPNISKDCNQNYELPNLADYEFVGLLTYLANGSSIETTSAYSAIEIRNGNAKSYAGGSICCTCEGEPLVPQKVDAVIYK